MMKKILTILTLTSTALMSSCNFLDFDESQGKTQEETYAYFDNVTSLASAAYRELPKDYGVIGGALRESATDNSVASWKSNSLYDMYNDIWSPKNLVDNSWSTYYPVIHDINSFLELYSEEELDRFKWDPNFKDNITKTRNYIYEVRALRAFYYFEMIKRFKDVPLLTKTCSLDEVNTLQKTSFKDVLDFMVKEWDEVKTHLPEDYENFIGGETGRVTKGAVMAFKSRALLYAASPLYAGFSNVTWEQAAKAALDVINLGVYILPNIDNDPLYDEDPGNNVLVSPQMIFEFRGSTDNSFERNNLPPTFTGGETKGYNNPTQNFVDAFEFKDGTSFDWNKPEHIAKMYYDEKGKETRDPRFYINVICNGMTYMNKKVDTYVGGLYGPHAEVEGYTLTGYYLKKLMNEKVDLDPAHQVKKPHHFPGYRYAEILLNYAEAMNEFKGPDYTDATFTMSARQALNRVRSAAFMPDVVANTQSEFRAKVRNERRIELAFEDHRFWDIRRWKIGNVVEKIYGVKINNVNGVMSANKEIIQTRVWDDKMYFYPIPQNEVFVNPNLTQNPGWTE